MIWLTAAIYALILVFELPALIKNHWHKEIVVFSVFFIIGVYLGMVQFYHWPFYNPLTAFLPYFADLISY